MPHYSYNEPRPICPMDMSPRSIACREGKIYNPREDYMNARNNVLKTPMGRGGANWGKSPVSSSPTTSKNLGVKNINRSIQSADQTIKEVKGVTAGLKNFLNNFGETGQSYSNYLTSWGLGKKKHSRGKGCGGNRWSYAPPVTIDYLAPRGHGGRVPRGRSSGLLSPAPGLAAMFGFKGRARPMRPRPRPSNSFAANTNAIANLLDSGVGLANVISASGKKHHKRHGKGWDLNGLLNELRPDSYMRSTWLPNAAAASQGAAALTGIFGPEAVVASEEALAPLTYAAIMNEILKSQGYGKSGKSRKSGHDGRGARAAIVKKVMQERGVSLPMASKIVKQEGLY